MDCKDQEKALFTLLSEEIDATMRRFSALPLGERVAAWAGWFVDLGKVGYLYGRDPGGYVTDGRICQDFETDCVLFTYRVTELARSTSAEEAAQFAFGTRFYGASIESVVHDDGTVDYDDPAHLEISEEMIESAREGDREATLQMLWNVVNANDPGTHEQRQQACAKRRPVTHTRRRLPTPSPASIIRASQYTVASGSDPRIDFCKALARS